ncbi:hypothetical protein GW17_00013112 [Ensete ventricosum]|nr:hypothetical protein GW17_00013112 [Ensete ventricosum]
MGGNPLWVGRYRLALAGYCPCRRPPLAGGLTTAGRPCRGPGRGQSPLHADSMHVAAPPPQTAPTFAANRCNKRVEQFYAIQSHHTQEIVYPCILDPDEEDEGGQASSSLAVSTRWISTAKLLQSDLTTLA